MPSWVEQRERGGAKDGVGIRLVSARRSIYGVRMVEPRPRQVPMAAS